MISEEQKNWMDMLVISAKEQAQKLGEDWVYVLMEIIQFTTASIIFKDLEKGKELKKIKKDLGFYKGGEK